VASVKGRRSYDGSRRRERARQTRQAVVDAAWRHFQADGYAATTIASIAATAGVSVETVYKSFGSKARLLRAIAESAIAGPGAVPTMRRSDEMAAHESDPYTIVRRWAEFATEVTPRGAPVVLLIRSSASGSAELAEVLAQLDDERLARMAHQARLLVERGYLRPDVTEAEARDVMWAYTDPGMYELLVLRQGWPLERYRDFLAGALTAALLPPRLGLS
jgi:AcrR family transcriptional regulator